MLEDMDWEDRRKWAHDLSETATHLDMIGEGLDLATKNVDDIAQAIGKLLGDTSHASLHDGRAAMNETTYAHNWLSGNGGADSVGDDARSAAGHLRDVVGRLDPGR
jgi:hypothetical protein